MERQASVCLSLHDLRWIAAKWALVPTLLLWRPNLLLPTLSALPWAQLCAGVVWPAGSLSHAYIHKYILYRDTRSKVWVNWRGIITFMRHLKGPVGMSGHIPWGDVVLQHYEMLCFFVNTLQDLWIQDHFCGLSQDKPCALAPTIPDPVTWC